MEFGRQICTMKISGLVNFGSNLLLSLEVRDVKIAHMYNELRIFLWGQMCLLPSRSNGSLAPYLHDALFIAFLLPWPRRICLTLLQSNLKSLNI